MYLNTSEFIINPSTEAIRHRLTNSDMQTIVHKNVRNHRKAARILLPEFFNHTQWLYINCKVNGFPAIALVDSGIVYIIFTETLRSPLDRLSYWWKVNHRGSILLPRFRVSLGSILYSDYGIFLRSRV